MWHVIVYIKTVEAMLAKPVWVRTIREKWGENSVMRVISRHITHEEITLAENKYKNSPDTKKYVIYITHLKLTQNLNQDKKNPRKTHAQ